MSKTRLPHYCVAREATDAHGYIRRVVYSASTPDEYAVVGRQAEERLLNGWTRTFRQLHTYDLGADSFVDLHVANWVAITRAFYNCLLAPPKHESNTIQSGIIYPAPRLRRAFAAGIANWPGWYTKLDAPKDVKTTLLACVRCAPIDSWHDHFAQPSSFARAKPTPRGSPVHKPYHTLRELSNKLSGRFNRVANRVDRRLDARLLNNGYACNLGWIFACLAISPGHSTAMTQEDTLAEVMHIVTRTAPWPEEGYYPSLHHPEAPSLEDRLKATCDVWQRILQPALEFGGVWQKSWNTNIVVGLSRAIYLGREWGRCPILADALEEAGCDHSGILTHLRSCEFWFPGDWVIDRCMNIPLRRHRLEVVKRKPK